MLKNKVAIITGASRGIGKSCAFVMAREGAKVVVNYHISELEAKKVTEKINSSGGNSFPYQANVSDANAVDEMVRSTIDRYGSVDVLVNNAGILGKGGNIDDINMDSYDNVWKVNVVGILNCSKAVIPIMKSKGKGSIVNIASVAGIGTASRPGNMLYGSTKAAVIILTKNMAMDLGSFGIRVNATAPGLIKTDMALEGKSRDEVERRLNYFREHSMLKKLGEPEDVAEVVAFLTSDRAKFITGQTLTIDGGRTDFLSHSF
jgi:3-oxoacyl-[acyl-carrier protein] reductase